MNNQLIEQLAQKLGVTCEYLWSALLRQAPINSACVAIGLVVFALLLAQAAKKLKAWPSEDSDYNELKMILIGAWILSLGLFIMVAIDTIPLIIAGFFNPEYWALHQIIK